MCKEKDRNFLFSIVLIFSLCLAIIAFFCGEEIMKTCCKVIASAFIVVVILICLYVLFCCIPNWKKVTISPKAIYGEKSMIINDSSNYERNIDDADFEDIVFIKANQKLEEGAFWGYSKLKKIKLPAELEEIPNYAFAGCVSLESITIPNSIKKIGEYAFFGCSNLKKINLSKTKVTEIKKGAFEDCKKLETVIFEVPENEEFQKLPETLKNVIRAGKSIKEIKLKTNNTELKSNLENLIKNEFADREIFVSVEG